jgi:hypothetical protein
MKKGDGLRFASTGEIRFTANAEHRAGVAG